MICYYCNTEIKGFNCPYCLKDNCQKHQRETIKTFKESIREKNNDIMTSELYLKIFGKPTFDYGYITLIILLISIGFCIFYIIFFGGIK